MLVMVVRLRFYQQAGNAVMPLTDTKVKNAKPLDKEYKLTDGFPDIGDKDVTELDTGDLLIPVKKVEALD
jgi:hypothetical protein